MTTIVKNFNTDLNFWEINPIFKTIKLFRDLHDSDKSKKKESSSQIMWAIVLLIDPNEANPWKNITEEDKKTLIAEDYLHDKKFNWIEIQPLIEEYEKRCLTIPEQELVRFQRKIVDRGNFIARTLYSIENASELDKMMSNTLKINQQYLDIQDMLKQEASQGSLRAGAEKSASEKGEI